MGTTAFGAAQCPPNYIIYPATLQRRVSFVDFAYRELVLMDANAVAQPPAVVLEWHADTIGGTEYKVFFARTVRRERMDRTVTKTVHNNVRRALQRQSALPV